MRDKKLRKRIVTVCFVVILFNSFLISTSNLSPNIKRKNEIWEKPISAANITLFSDDFESGLSNWETITGLWHMTNDSSSWPNPYHSYRNSMWFGNESTGTYNTGTRVTGSLVTQPIDLSSETGAYLDFFQWRSTEGAPWDMSYVHVSTNNVSWTTINQTGINISPWGRLILDLSNFIGNASVRIKFEFDSIDGAFNDFRGWLVDDVQVYTEYIPLPPTLSAITPNPSINGIINLVWSRSLGATIYYVYRNTSVITSTIGLSPIISTTAMSGQDMVGADGTYYYVVVAGNRVGNSSISNCQSVVVSLSPPVAPALYSITPNPSTTGIINLAWSSSSGATIYYVYRNTSVITSTAGLSPIFSITTTSGQNTIGTNGTYYYVVVAGNWVGNSSISTCQSVIVAIPPPPRNYMMQVGVPYNWIDATMGGTQLFLGNDGTSARSLPFSFTYYGKSYTTVYVSANGWLSFVNTNPSTSSNQPFPSSSSSYAYAIAPFWDNLSPGDSGNQVYVKSGPNYWVMAWINVPHYYGPIVGTFEVILYSNGTILFQYEYIDFTGGGYTCGLNYGDGVIGNAYSGLTPSTSNLAISFKIIPPSITHPSDFEYAINTTEHTISWTIEDLEPRNPQTCLYNIYCNGILNGTGTWAPEVPITINIDNLSIGCYNYSITAITGYGESLNDEVWVTVLFLAISRPVDIIYPERSIGNTLSWTISAAINGTTLYTILRNDSEVLSGSWEPGIGIVIIIDGLPIGCYNFSINATDGLGNLTRDDVIVTVIPNVSYLAVTHPLDKTYGTNEYGKSITWRVTAENFADGNYTIFRDGFNITNGTWIAPNLLVTKSLDGLPVGWYNFTLALIDCWGVTIQDEVGITITPPTSHLNINTPPDFNYVQNAIGNYFTWVITAEHEATGTYKILLNGSQIDSGAWEAPGRSIKVDVDSLTPGQYNYMIVLEDCWGASVQGTVLVTVTSPPNLMFDQIILYMIMLGIGLAAFLVVYAIKRYISKSRSTSHLRHEYKYSKYGRLI